MRNSLPLIVTIAFSIVGVVGDYFLKLASDQSSLLKSGTFYLGFIVYASTAFGWVYVMRHLKLATIGAGLLRIDDSPTHVHRCDRLPTATQRL